jgi:tetratricopeptide (TPR) repeat protein
MFKVEALLRRRPRKATIVITGVFGVIAILFFISTVAVHAYNAKLNQLSRDWAREGDRDLAAGNAQRAIQEYRDALAYDAKNAGYQLHLAQALTRLGETDEARAYLLHLWTEAPGDGVVNLELARLSARTGATDDAVKYLHNAIYGVWEIDPEQHRREARFELIRLLLQQDRKNQADAELISVLASMPHRPDAYSQTGGLFLQAGDASRALDQFRRALRLAPTYEDALRGAGTAAFQSGELGLAQEYLSKAAAAQPNKPQVQSMLATIRLVRHMDPFGFRLSRQERAARVRNDFQTAMQRLQTCVSQHPSAAEVQAQLASGQTMAQQIAKPNYLRSADAIDSTMSFVFQAESQATKSCPTSQPADSALELIGRMRESR